MEKRKNTSELIMTRDFKISNQQNTQTPVFLLLEVKNYIVLKLYHILC